MKEIIDVLYDQVINTNAGEGHVQFKGIKNDHQAIAVVSVYHGQRPSHEVLNDLYEWAEKRKDKTLLDKIEELSMLVDVEGD